MWSRATKIKVLAGILAALLLVMGLAIFLLSRMEGVRDEARQVTHVLRAAIEAARVDPEEARKELQAELDKIKAAGEPTSLQEIIPPEVPDEENAAVVYQKAFEKLNLSEEDEDVLYDLLSSMAQPPRSEAPPLATIEQIVANNAAVIALTERASKYSRCRFPLDWEAGHAMIMAHLHELRTCALLLEAKAALQIGRGEVSEALHTIEIGLSMCEAVGDEPSVVSQLVRYSIASILRRPLHVALDEKVSTAACRGLFDYLAGTEFMQSFVHSLWGERVMGIHMFDAVRQDPEQGWTMLVGEDAASDGSLYATPVGQSILNVDEAMYLRLMARRIAAAEKSSWDSREDLAEIDRRVEDLSFPHLVTTILLPVYARVTAKRDSTIARVGLAQVALALKAYKNEKGEYPESLAKLREVIDWGKLPEDPFSSEDFIYQREGEGFLVYSIGVNLADDGGKVEEDWEEGDIVWRCER